jgi:hypothetical protein
VWLTPAGTQDEGGVLQPAYLNFDIALMSPPAGNEMQVRARICLFGDTSDTMCLVCCFVSLQ